MVLELLVRNSPSQPLNRVQICSVDDVHEFVAICPGCKTLEMLSFNNAWLTQTCKFSQCGEQVFHDCGMPVPGHLYRYC